jgi:hypothetical protein
MVTDRKSGGDNLNLSACCRREILGNGRAGVSYLSCEATSFWPLFWGWSKTVPFKKNGYVFSKKKF